MYYVCKRLEISAAHSLMLSYESKCEDLHGHNWIVKIYCKSETLNQDGMVTDFTLIKRDIEKALDQGLHHVLVCLPYSMGGMVDTLHSGAQVKSVDYTADGIEIETVVDEILYGRLKKYIIEEL